jgi:hypothetical protein
VRPTTTELLEILDHILETQITPRLPDEHSKARMSVASQVLRAAHNRVRLEGQMLATDNAEIVALLAQLRGVEIPGGEAMYVSVESLAERNDQLRAELVTAINGIDDLPENQRQAPDSAVNAYLRRQLDRELAITALPTFGEISAELPLV